MIHPAQKKIASIQYGDSAIEFAIEPRLTDTPKVLIKVHPDCRVVAHAPPLASDDEIIRAVKKRARWIHRQMRYFEDQRKDILPRRYVSGESHFYLGRRHVLKVHEAPRSTPEVKLLRGILEIKTRTPQSEKIRSLLFDWYKTKAREVFDRRLEEVLPQTLWVKEKTADKTIIYANPMGQLLAKRTINDQSAFGKSTQRMHRLCIAT